MDVCCVRSRKRRTDWYTSGGDQQLVITVPKSTGRGSFFDQQRVTGWIDFQDFMVCMYCYVKLFPECFRCSGDELLFRVDQTGDEIGDASESV